MKSAALPIALLMLTTASGAWASLLYDNTSTDTGDTVLYSIGPYTALGDQIQLDSAGVATQAEVELFNNGAAGTFDAELDFFNVGSPVGSFLGSSALTDISSVGGDVLDLTFDLAGGLTVPQDLIFTVTINNASAGLDLGVDMFEPPTVGSSDNSFMIVESDGIYYTFDTNSQNVYFQLSGTESVAAPEAWSCALLGNALLVIGLGAWLRRRLSAPESTTSQSQHR